MFYKNNKNIFVGGEGLEPPKPKGGGFALCVRFELTVQLSLGLLWFHPIPFDHLGNTKFDLTVYSVYSPLQLPLCDPPKLL